MGVGGFHLPGAALDEAARAELVHQVPGREALADVLLVVDLSPRIDGRRPGGHDPGGEGNVGGDHHVRRRGLGRDMIVGRVEIFRDDHGRDQW